MIVYCATSNPGKLREFQLAAPDFDVRALPKSVPPPDETGDTFEANAIQKAIAYGQQIDGYLFADDSGLEVDALKGEPGVHSARYAGDHATDTANNALLLDRLRGVENRTARFVCVIALVDEDQFGESIEGEDGTRAGAGMGGAVSGGDDDRQTKRLRAAPFPGAC